MTALVGTHNEFEKFPRNEIINDFKTEHEPSCNARRIVANSSSLLRLRLIRNVSESRICCKRLKIHPRGNEVIRKVGSMTQKEKYTEIVTASK